MTELKDDAIRILKIIREKDSGWIKEVKGKRSELLEKIKMRLEGKLEAIFAIDYTETYSDTYFVKAKSYEEAIKKLEYAIMNGHVNGPSQCCDSRYHNTSYDYTEEELADMHCDVE
jgi:hypothetical protein